MGVYDLQATVRLEDPAQLAMWSGPIAVPPPGRGQGLDDQASREQAKRTYAQGVAVTKEVVNSIRLGRTTNVKKAKRAVQLIVDQVLNNETSIIGLTTLRDYDEYTFTHSVNVCIFAIAIGRRMGLTRIQLYDLGLTALLHDIGKARLPLEVLNKPSGLNDAEWQILQTHTWRGSLAHNDITSFAQFGQDLTHLNEKLSLNFGAENSVIHLETIQQGLYAEYYFPYLVNLFNLKNRLVHVKTNLPISLLTKLQLNDRLIIRDKRYIINEMKSNLTTGEVNFSLYLDFRPLTSGKPYVPSFDAQCLDIPINLIKNAVSADITT